VVAFAFGVPVALAGRADPRRDDPPDRTAPVVDPSEAVTALRSLDPPIDVHRITADQPDAALPTRWRLAALDTYDGQRWTPSVELRPIGRRLGATPPDAVSFHEELGTRSPAHRS
jgi:hypothetical protein